MSSSTPDQSDVYSAKHRLGVDSDVPDRPPVVDGPEPTPRMWLGDTSPMRSFVPEPYPWGGSR